MSQPRISVLLWTDTDRPHRSRQQCGLQPGVPAGGSSGIQRIADGCSTICRTTMTSTVSGWWYGNDLDDYGGHLLDLRSMSKYQFLFSIQPQATDDLLLPLDLFSYPTQVLFRFFFSSFVCLLCPSRCHSQSLSSFLPTRGRCSMVRR